MSDNKILKDVINQHESAMRVFKGCYSFDTKQKDILFYLETSLRKYQAEQLADQNKVAALSKKIDKRQVTIESLLNQLEITKSVTELDIGNDRE